MPTLSGVEDALLRYDHAVITKDTSAAVVLAGELLAGGMPPVAVLTDVIAAAQRLVGDRWQRGEWSVAQEHAATAIAVAATEAVVAWADRQPVTKGRVLIACAEREWHSLPAAMIGCALRADGWQIEQLGASPTSLRLSRMIQDLGPEVVAVSCSVLGSLPTTRRFIEASTAAGVPIVVGGTAFGGDDVRARALGATAWAGNAEHAVAVVNGVPAVVEPAPPLPDGPAREQSELELEHRRIVERVRSRWSVTAEVNPRMREVARDALPQTLHAVSAALLTGDVRPVSETAGWLAELLHGRGAPAGAVAELGEILATTLLDYPLSTALIRRHFVVAAEPSPVDESPVE